MQRPEYRYEFQPWKVKLQGFKGLALMTWWSGLSIWLLLWILTGGAARASIEELEALKRMSIDDLANLEVSIVSGRPERLGETAAAIFVISAEDIRRSGATTLAEVLRLVPGFSVGRIDTAAWAISARGFQSQLGNKLLVLIDGRSVYTPLFSGVFWESQNILLQDVERIEVVRGPGATTWGANAVNGVINILTRHTQDTQGTYMSMIAGNRQQQWAARQGGRLGEKAAYRLYAKLHQEDTLPVKPGFVGENHSWKGGRAGFRVDWPTAAGSVLLEGELSNEQQEYGQSRGNHLLGRWEQHYANGSIGTLQGYYYRFDSDNVMMSQVEDTLDLEYRLRLPPVDRHTVVAGAGYRWIRSTIEPISSAKIRQPVRQDQLISAFVQDDIRLVEDRLYLTLGTKIEHNDYTNFEVQPSARLRWLPADGQTLWAAVSRAVRTPSRSETDFSFSQRFGEVEMPPLGRIPLLFDVAANPSMVSEELLAWETGYRWQLSPRLSLDTAFFLNDYDRLASAEWIGSPNVIFSPGPMVVVNTRNANKLHGRTRGLEVVADYQPWDGWRIQGSYSLIRMSMKPDADSTDTLSRLIGQQSPVHQWSLRSSMDLSDHLELDLWLRYVDAIPILAIDSYLDLDARVGWRVDKNFNLSLIGRNLLDSRHLEYKAFLNQDQKTAEVAREIYLMAEWRF